MTPGRLMLLAAVALAVVAVAAGIDLGRAPEAFSPPRAAPVAERPPGLATVDPDPVPEGEEHLPEPHPAPTAAPRRTGKAAPDADTAPPLPPERVSAATVARAYAEQSINWTATTLPRQHRRLATLSAGSLREQNRAAAVDRVALERLRRDGAGQRGTVRGVEIAPAYAGEATAEVRTSERAFGRSLGPSRPGPAVYQARLARNARGWHVVGWRPQP